MEIQRQIGRRLVQVSEDTAERFLVAQTATDHVLVTPADQGCEVILVTFRPSSYGEAVETVCLTFNASVKDVTAWVTQRATARVFTVA